MKKNIVKNIVMILFAALIILSIIYIRVTMKPKVAFMPITIGPVVYSSGIKALEEAKPSSFNYKIFPVEQSPESAVENVEKVLKEGYRIILAPEWTSSMVFNVAKNFDDILIVAAFAVSDELRMFSNKIITLAPSILSLARFMGEKILKDGIEKLLIVIDSTNPTFAQAYIKGISEEIGGKNIKISTVYVKPGEEIKSITSKLEPFLEMFRKERSGVLFICEGREVAIAMNYLKTKNVHLKYYSSSYCISENLYRFGKEVVKGLVITSYKPRKYENIDDIDYLMYLYAYDAIKVLDEALKKVRGGDPEKVREYIINHRFSGKTGIIIFNKDGFRNYIDILGLEVIQ